MKLLIALAALGVIASPAAAQDRSHWRTNQMCSSRYHQHQGDCSDRYHSGISRRDWQHQSYRDRRGYRERIAYDARHRYHRSHREDTYGNRPGR